MRSGQQTGSTSGAEPRKSLFPFAGSAHLPHMSALLAMRGTYTLYERLCRLFGMTPLPDRERTFIPTEGNTVCVSFANSEMTDYHTLACIISLMRNARVPPPILGKVLRVYVSSIAADSFTNDAGLYIRGAVHSPTMEQLLYDFEPDPAAANSLDFSYWHFEGNPFTGRGAALIVAAAICMGRGKLDLDISNCQAVLFFDMSMWADFIDEMRVLSRGAPFGLRGLRMDGCPILSFTNQSTRLFPELHWLSLRGTAFKNLWTMASVLGDLPNLRGVLIDGDPSEVTPLDHLRAVSCDGRNTVGTSSSGSSSSFTVARMGYPSQSVRASRSIHYKRPSLKASHSDASTESAGSSQSFPRRNEPYPDVMPYLQVREELLRSQSWKSTPRTPVTQRAHYRNFLLAHAKPSLLSLDEVCLTSQALETARTEVLRHFDFSPHETIPQRIGLFRQLRNRELELSSRRAALHTRHSSGSDSNTKRRREGTTLGSNSPSLPLGRRRIAELSSYLLSPLSRPLEKSLTESVSSGTCQIKESPTSTLRKFVSADFPVLRKQTSRLSNGDDSIDYLFNRAPIPTGLLREGFTSSRFERDASISLLGRPGQPCIDYLCQPQDRPRQFEYSHIDPRLLVYGTEQANLVVLNQDTGTVVGSCITGGGRGHIAPGESGGMSAGELPNPPTVPPARYDDRNKSVLGLSWFNKDPNRFIAGGESGAIHVYSVEWMATGYRGGCINACDTFPRLTSIHANCTDEKFLVSGYTRDIGLYDMETGSQIENIRNCHMNHINVLKFSNTNPNVFVTSSFDRCVKKWDLRERRPDGSRRPIFNRRSQTGNVMVCFSPDDEYILVSAVNNEVLQYTASDGRLERSFDIPKSPNEHNYTRSYYMNGRDYVISGSCNEDVIRIYNARTGQFFKEIDMDNRRGSRDRIVYVQSLRANPRKEFSFSALLSLQGQAPYLIIARADLHSRAIE